MFIYEIAEQCIYGEKGGDDKMWGVLINDKKVDNMIYYNKDTARQMAIEIMESFSEVDSVKIVELGIVGG